MENYVAPEIVDNNRLCKRRDPILFEKRDKCAAVCCNARRNLIKHGKRNRSGNARKSETSRKLSVNFRRAGGDGASYFSKMFLKKWLCFFSG